MSDILTQEYKKFIIDGELGENALKLIDIVDKCPNNEILVDIGVESGKSSKILLHMASEKGNSVYGIDPIKGINISGILDHPNYTFIQDDSVKIGQEWNKGQIYLAFIDSVHVKPQVLRELYYWWDLVKVGGWLVFHDTQWQNYIHKSNHPCAGKKPGNTGLGYDYYAGKGWETPDIAIKEFFRILLLNIQNNIISSEHFSGSLGMTFIQKKKEHNYKLFITNWEQIENDRQSILKCFK